jgi:tetratricopeptide (TPR) repeat protein
MALISFDEALPLREALVADSPNDPKTLSNLAWCLIRKGDVLQMLSRNEEAASQYTRVMAVLGPPMNSAQIDPDVAKYYSMAVVSRADVLIEQKKPDEALEIYSRELDRREAVAREHPGDANALRDASNIAVRISEWLRTSNKPKEALQYSERALTLRLQRLAIDPDSDRGKRDVATGHRYVALCLLDDQQASAAVEQLEKGLGIAQKLWKSAAAEDAGEARSPMTVAVILETLGLALRQEGKPHEAVNRHLEAIAVIEPFADPARDDVDSQRILAYLQYHVGKTQFEFLNDSEGLDQLRASRATLQHLTDTGTSKDGDRQFLDDIEAILSRQSSSSQ